jgi:hypothetical protein
MVHEGRPSFVPVAGGDTTPTGYRLVDGEALATLTGSQLGDVWLSWAGQPIDSDFDLRRAIRALYTDRLVVYEVLRDGEALSLALAFDEPPVGPPSRVDPRVDWTSAGPVLNPVVRTDHTVQLQRDALAFMVEEGWGLRGPLLGMASGVTVLDGRSVGARLGLEHGVQITHLDGWELDAERTLFDVAHALLTQPQVSLSLQGDSLPLQVLIDGPPVVLPPGWPGGEPPAFELEKVWLDAGLERRNGAVVMPRGALALGMEGFSFSPRRGLLGKHLGYRLFSPLMNAAGVQGTVVEIDGVPLVDDATVIESALGLFFQDETEWVIDRSGLRESVKLTLVGDAVAPPDGWAPSVHIDASEARMRSGVRLQPNGVVLPREALRPTLDHGVESVSAVSLPMSASAVFGREVSRRLGLHWLDLVVSVQGLGVVDEQSMVAARRTLLQESQVEMVLERGSKRTVVLTIEGPPAAGPGVLQRAWSADERAMD